MNTDQNNLSTLPLSGGERAGAAQSKSIDCTSHAAPARQQSAKQSLEPIGGDAAPPYRASEQLSQDEVFELERCERIIEKNLEAALWFAQALGTIRDKKLYRAGYSTFEQYCRERWEMPARSARRLIDQADVFKRLSEGQNGSAWTVPARPSVVRPLITLPPEHQRPAWQEAVETSRNGQPTVRHVEKVVREYQVQHGLRQPELEPATDARNGTDILPLSGGERPGLETPVRKCSGNSKPVPVPVTIIFDDPESATEQLIKSGRHFVDCMGTPDSSIATEVQRMLVMLEEYKSRRARMEFARINQQEKARRAA